MPASEIRRQLQQIKATNQTLYAATKVALDDIRAQARSQGGQQMISQMGGAQ